MDLPNKRRATAAPAPLWLSSFGSFILEFCRLLIVAGARRVSNALLRVRRMFANKNSLFPQKTVRRNGQIHWCWRSAFEYAARQVVFGLVARTKEATFPPVANSFDSVLRHVVGRASEMRTYPHNHQELRVNRAVPVLGICWLL